MPTRRIVCYGPTLKALVFVKSGIPAGNPTQKFKLVRCLGPVRMLALEWLPCSGLVTDEITNPILRRMIWSGL